MPKENKRSEIQENVLRYVQRTSWAKKRANNFKWAEDVADFFDLSYDPTKNEERVDRLKFNYDLYSGKGDGAMEEWAYSNTPEVLLDEGINVAEYENIRHHDIISPITKELFGEQTKRPFVPMAQDSSEYTLNQRKRKRLELLQEYLRENIIGPIEERETLGVFQEQGIDDPFQLSPEQQQGVQAQVQERVQAKTPSEIHDFLRKDYKSPSEIQAQTLIDYLSKELKLKYMFDEGFKHALITGEEVYRIGVLHNEPFVDLVDPIGFSSSGAKNKFFIEDGEWARYEEYITLRDVYDRYGDILTNKDLNRLDQIALPNNERDITDRITSELVAVTSVNPQKYFGPDGVDQRTRSGQSVLRDVRENHLGLAHAQSLIRHVHITWVSSRKLYLVTRALEEGSIVKFWQDESYTFDTLKGDVKLEEAWVPWVWETTKMGYGSDAIYVNKQPLPYQYRSIHNPFGPKLPYYGAYYGKLMGNASNTATMDLGKPWQFKFNRVLAKIEEKEAMDLGKVIVVWDALRPEGMPWGKWLLMMKYGHLLPVDLADAGITPQDLQSIKALDLSNIFDLGQHLEYLTFIKDQCALAMGLNPSRLGQISPHMAVTTNQQSIAQSINQTEDLYRTHNQIGENVLNGLVGASRIAYRDNPPKKSFVLDDMSIAELELDWELLWRSEIGVFMTMNGSEIQNLDIVKQQSQSMIQNGLINFPELVKLQFAQSPAEVLNLAEKAQERQDAMQQQAQEAQQQEAELNRQLQISVMEKENQMKLLMQQNELESQERRTEVDATKFAKQFDIDQDGVNDSIERERIKLAAESALENRKLDIQDKEVEFDYEIDLKKIEVEKKKISSQPPKRTP